MRTSSFACLVLALSGCSSPSKFPMSKALAATAAPVAPAPVAIVAMPVAASAAVADWASTRSRLAEQRSEHLARLHDYAAAGRFPVNRVRRGRLNVFIDDRTGALCAVANLMSRSGATDLVSATAARDNFIRLADLHEGALYDWILGSGFTQEEIALIQEPYFYQGDDGQTDVPPEPAPPQAAAPSEPVSSQPVQPSPAVREKRRLQRHFRDVEARLRAETERSLDLATARLLGRSASI